MTQQLTTGAIKVLYNDEKSSPLYNKPHVQVINIKPVSVTGGTRYRVILSDGVHFMQAMLAASHSNIVEDQSLKRNSIIQLNESVCNLLQNRKILIVLNIDIIKTDVESKIGAPTTLEGANTSSPSAKQEPSNQSALSGPVKSSGFSSGSGANMQLEASLTPIKNLNPYQTRWTIKARITQKSPIKKWHNAKGDGQLFSVNLLDQTGEIKATAFNDQVDRLYNIFEEGKVYYISKARVTMAKKQFSTLNNEYELGLEHGTEIEACGAESSIPQMSYDFVKIADLDKHEKGSNVDILGVVIEDQGMSEIIAKATGKPTKKREITIADDSNKSVRLTLWDTAAEEFDSNGSPVLACKGARVGDFNGRTLSLGGNSTFKRNPEIPEAQNLQKWYREKGNSSSFDTFSSSGMVGLGGEVGISPSKMLTLQQAKSEGLGSGDKPAYFTFRGTVVFIRTENFAYPGCPECKKKLLLEESGWRCERCMKSFKTPDYRYIVTMSTEDATSQVFINGFDEIGRSLLKMDANELMRLKENDSAAAQVVFNKALFQTFIFKVKAKQETFNDIHRIKYSAIDIKPIDFVKEGEALASAIEQMFI